MKIYGIYEQPPYVPVSGGNKYVQNYEEYIDKNGNTGLRETTVDNLYEIVQMATETCDIAAILEKYERTRDISFLNKVKGVYADITEMPKDLMEVQNGISQINNYFEQLPGEIKELFGNNSNKFLAGITDGSSISKIQNFENSKKSFAESEPTKKEEVKKDE